MKNQTDQAWMHPVEDLRAKAYSLVLWRVLRWQVRRHLELVVGAALGRNWVIVEEKQRQKWRQKCSLRELKVKNEKDQVSSNKRPVPMKMRITWVPEGLGLPALSRILRYLSLRIIQNGLGKKLKNQEKKMNRMDSHRDTWLISLLELKTPKMTRPLLVPDTDWIVKTPTVFARVFRLTSY